MGVKMPGNLYFYRENDIIQLSRKDCIGSSGMVPLPLLLAQGRYFQNVVEKIMCVTYNILNKGAGR